MSIKTNLLEDYDSYVDSTKKQNTCFKMFIGLFVIIVSLFSFYFVCKYLTEYQFFFKQFSKPGNLDSNSIFRESKLNLMARFVEIKPFNLRLGQHQLA